MEIGDAEACDVIEGKKRCGIAVDALRYRCGGLADLAGASRPV